MTHLNGFGKNESKAEENNSDLESENENSKQKKNDALETNVGLHKNDLKHVNKLVAKNVSKTKAFAHIKQQSQNKDPKSSGGKKVNKLQKKFSKKSMESKRAKHYNPKNKSHKKNKKM